MYGRHILSFAWFKIFLLSFPTYWARFGLFYTNWTVVALVTLKWVLALAVFCVIRAVAIMAFYWVNREELDIGTLPLPFLISWDILMTGFRLTSLAFKRITSFFALKGTTLGGSRQSLGENISIWVKEFVYSGTIFFICIQIL